MLQIMDVRDEITKHWEPDLLCPECDTFFEDVPGQLILLDFFGCGVCGCRDVDRFYISSRKVRKVRHP